MSNKKLYANEIASAHIFIVNHSNDCELMSFLADIRSNKDLTHSDRWSMCFDFLAEHYPEVTGTIVTGMVYYVED